MRRGGTFLAKMLAIGCCLFGLAASIRAAEPAPVRDEAEKWTVLFDGKSLDGWQGDKSVFRIEDGAIVGGSLKGKVAHNDFLTYEKKYANFELRLKFKLLGKGANGGIQLRSQRVPNNFEMIGYQADLGDGYWGSLYDESRRKKTLVAPKPDDIAKVLKRDDWNDYRILCEGRHVQLWVNDLQTVDYTEPDESLDQSGYLGLQIHGGGPTEAWYKEIKIRELP